MKTPPFDYHDPATLDEVLALLAEHGDEAKVLAGGQSLVPLLAMRLARPSVLVDLNRVDSLAGIRDGGDVVAVGAMTRERVAERSAAVAAAVPALAAALPLIGHVSIRNRGTLGGSIAHADASAELPAVAVTTGATIVARRADGEREIAADDFFVGHFSTTLADDECLTEIRFPKTASRSGWALHEIARRHGDFALVGALAMVRLDERAQVGEARVTLMGVAERPLRCPSVERALVGALAGPDTWAGAAADAQRDLDPPSDVHGSAAVRRHLAGVAVRRALHDAATRAEEIA